MTFSKQQTFRDLDDGVVLPPPESMLEEWYLQVRDVAIADFDVFNLARACRQNLFVEVVVPFCLQKLLENPLAGELYDGELLISLKSVANDYWKTHPIEKSLLLSIAKRAFQESGDADLHFETNFHER